MSFLDHLDELRSRLIRSAAFVLVAFIICWYFSDVIYNFLEIPVRAAMLKSEQAAGFGIKTDLKTLWDLPDGTEVDFTLPTDARVGGSLIQTGGTIRLKVQVNEDGSRDLVTTKLLIINTATVLPEGTVIPRALYSTSSGNLNPDNKLIVGTVQGAFNLYIKVSFYAAIFFAVPFLLTQVWGFVAPGLYPHEKKYAAPFIIMTSLFFLIGCAFAYYIAFPRAADFLLGVAAEGELRPLVSADEYFDLIILIMLGLGLVFEIPTVTYFLSRLGIVTPQPADKVLEVRADNHLHRGGDTFAHDRHTEPAGLCRADADPLFPEHRNRLALLSQAPQRRGSRRIRRKPACRKPF